ncbi:hypothetical protein V5069_08260 [Citrobacter freundii]|uniref:hypothetical protein n=1 Tax=Citrobacter freundii TaxID=546 RepID=UPI00307606E7
MSIKFDILNAEIPIIQALPQNADASGFFIQEVLRFHSLAGTMLNSGFSLNVSCSVDERYLTHVLTRSLLEPFFIILYIFDDLTHMPVRYEEQKNTFKEQYLKLMNDLNAPEWSHFMQNHGSQLQSPNPSWSKLNKLPDVKSMLHGLKNAHNNRLDYLYPLYRITSFDTHGRSLGTIFESVFGKVCNFPVLDIEKAIEYIADGYIFILNDLRQNKVI